ncbi:MAG: hypothetical protein V1718_01040 [archaeon]
MDNTDLLLNGLATRVGLNNCSLCPAILKYLYIGEGTDENPMQIKANNSAIHNYLIENNDSYRESQNPLSLQIALRILENNGLVGKTYENDPDSERQIELYQISTEGINHITNDRFDNNQRLTLTYF